MVSKTKTTEQLGREFFKLERRFWKLYKDSLANGSLVLVKKKGVRR